nr:ribonuclease HII [Lactobacillus iners]
MTIAEIKKLLSSGDVSTDLLITLENDSRQGVQRLVKSYKMQRAKKEKAFLEFETRFSYEKEFWCQNKLVAGVDEVGRGPLAGPVVTAAVILDKNFDLIDVNDSKKLTPKKRNELFPMILDKAVCVSVGLANNDLIDKINIYEADRVAMARAVKGLKVKPDALLVDAMDVPIDLPQLKLIRGDSKSNSIAAASIVAKVFRDRLMDAYGEIYPEYDFAHNAGYGTAKHLSALKQYGPTPIHRFSFEPVSSYR